MNILCRQSHDHETAHRHDSERRVKLATLLAVAMTGVEVAGGYVFGSMALVADGWHMSTHALALGVGAFAYWYARTRAHHPAYSFGTGKVHALGSFTSALLLALVAAIVFGESAWRLWHPKPIAYSEAIPVACLGLAVNLFSVWLLRQPIDEHGPHDHGDRHVHAHDHNRKAAFAHVETDALTSLLAIGALFAAKYTGFIYADPLIGIVGACIIAQWAWGLLRVTLPVLLDRQEHALTSQIRSAMEACGAEVVDLHVWQVGPGQLSAILSLFTSGGENAEFYKQKLAEFGLAHVTVEVNRAEMSPETTPSL